MPATKTQLTGGSFQDSSGVVLANGYLMFRLNQDASVASVGNVAAGVEIKITLNSSGSVDTSTPQYIWANDVLTPGNTYYTVTGYSSKGQPAWGPNNQQVTSGGTGGGTFDLGTWVPNQVFSWNPPLQPITLQTNETNNGDQTLLDLHAGSNVTLVDNGLGRVTISAVGASISSGTSVFPIMDVIFANPASSFDAFPWTVITRVPGTSLTSFPGTSKISIEMLNNAGQTLGHFQNCCVKRTLRDSTVVIDSTPITWGGTASPTLGIGIFTSDSFTLSLDALHDYFFMWFVPFVSGNDMLFQPFNTTLAEGGRYGTSGSVDHTSDTNLNAGLNGTNFGSVIKTWQAA